MRRFNLSEWAITHQPLVLFMILLFGAAGAYSYFNLVSSDPPHVMFSSSGVKDSLTNARVSGEFVLNMATVELVEAMNFTATDFPPDHAEFSWRGITPVSAPVDSTAEEQSSPQRGQAGSSPSAITNLCLQPGQQM